MGTGSDVVLAATDLDNTVIYPAASAAPGATVVECATGGSAAVMTGHAATIWASLTARDLVIPATGRTTQQYLRLTWPGRHPSIAVTLNGAEILIGGVPDNRWRNQYRRRVTQASIGLDAVASHVRKLAIRGIIRGVYLADDVYCVAIMKSEPAEESLVAELTVWAEANGWRATVQGSDLFLTPDQLDKQHAITHVACARGSVEVVAGGDSWLDVGMLRAASEAIRPAHGVLQDCGWSAPNCSVTRESGPDAANEILSWYATRCGVDFG